MRRTKFSLVAATAAALLFAVSASLSIHAQDKTGSIHGHVQSAAGVPLADGIIGIGAPGEKVPKYTFNTDANGDYKGSGIEAGTYSVFLREPTTPADKVVDEFADVKIVAGADTLQDFDMTRPAYLATLTPEQRKLAEETRAKNASAVKDNAVIKNLNANLAKARDDIKAKNYTEADSLMSQATQAKPDASVLWLELGTAQSGEKKFDDAATSLQKAIDLDAASKKPNPDIQGAAGNALGEVFANQGKTAQATAAYEAAAKINPSQAGMYYSNEAIILNRMGNKDPSATAAAADRAIAADPTKPIPYYLKGQALIGQATVDTKTGKYVMPPGCVEAYQKYLELAPDGPMAAEVKAILEGMGQTVKSSYKAKK